jgi:hypothetical protein
MLGVREASMRATTLRQLRPRRASDRGQADWLGRYTVERWPELGSGHCRVLDVSLAGAGLELFGPAIDNTAGEHLLLELQVVDPEPAGICLRGLIRNVDTTDQGVRVGVEFVDLRDLERVVLASLLERPTR